MNSRNASRFSQNANILLFFPHSVLGFIILSDIWGEQSILQANGTDVRGSQQEIFVTHVGPTDFLSCVLNFYPLAGLVPEKNIVVEY